MKYEVEITKTSIKKVEIEADSRAEAEELVEAGWNQEKYVLNADDFSRAYFSAEEVKEKIKVMLIKPKCKPEMVQIGTDLKDMQAIVGGNIQVHQPFDDDVAIICNEEGKLSRLPLNRAVYDENGEVLDIIAGDFFICDAPVTSETFQSLNSEQVKKYDKMFREPERFYPTMSGMKVEKIKSKQEMER